MVTFDFAKPTPLRILMVNWDGGGNIPPQRALARELVRRGHSVHVLTHDTLFQSFKDDGAQPQRLSSAKQWDPSRSLSEDEEGAFIGNGIAGSREFANDLLEVCDSLAPDVCLVDSMLMTCILVLQERNILHAVINHLAWNPNGSVASLFDSLSGVLPALPAGTSLFPLIERAPLVLATTYPELGRAPSQSSNVHFVGPIREPVEPAHPLRRFPQFPLVLAGGSTIAQQQRETLIRIATALADLPVEGLITTGRSIPPDSLPKADSIQAYDFLPHDKILPAVKLVICHGGLGTIMYSIGAGVPCLCLGEGRDQKDNSLQVEKLGLGRALPYDSPPEVIASAVAEMLADSALYERCVAFSAKVVRFGELTRAAQLIESLVTDVKN